MPSPFKVRGATDPTRDLGEWTEEGGIKLPGDLEVAGAFTVVGPLTVDNPQLTAFSKGVTFAGTFPSAASYIVWRALKPCVVTALRAYRVGGTGAVVNGKVNSGNLLSVDLSVSTEATWLSGTGLQNTNMAEGDSLFITLVSTAGTPTQLGVQIDLRTP